MCYSFLMFCSGNLFCYNVQMANENVHKLRFKAIFGLESNLSATSVQYFVCLLGFAIFQISQVFGFVFSEMSVALGWSSKAPVPLTKCSQLFYPYGSYGLPCSNRSDLDSQEYMNIYIFFSSGGVLESSHSMFLFYTG